MSKVALRAGVVIGGKYRLEARLGGGGMGEVYRATHVDIGRVVAIKVLHPNWLENSQVVARFLQEARAANRVRHRNVVDVLDIGEDMTYGPFIVQEFLDGQDLASALRDAGPIPLDTALRLLIPIADAIGAGHAQGVVHRDIKLANVLLAQVDGRTVPKVLDFGLARIADDADVTRMTAQGVAIGTPTYMAPEIVQEGSRHADARSDVWALGVVIYRVLSGELPFSVQGTARLFVAICRDPHVPITTRVKGLPKEIVAIIDRCLAKSASERFARADVLADALRDVLTQQNVPKPAGAIKIVDKEDDTLEGWRMARPASLAPAQTGTSELDTEVVDARPAHDEVVSAIEPSMGTLPADAALRASEHSDPFDGTRGLDLDAPPRSHVSRAPLSLSEGPKRVSLPPPGKAPRDVAHHQRAVGSFAFALAVLTLANLSARLLEDGGAFWTAHFADRATYPILLVGAAALGAAVWLAQYGQVPGNPVPRWIASAGGVGLALAHFATAVVVSRVLRVSAPTDWAKWALVVLSVGFALMGGQQSYLARPNAARKNVVPALLYALLMVAAAASAMNATRFIADW